MSVAENCPPMIPQYTQVYIGYQVLKTDNDKRYKISTQNRQISTWKSESVRKMIAKMFFPPTTPVQ